MKQTMVVALGFLLWGCGGSEPVSEQASIETQYTLTPEARKTLETCIADETEGRPDADRQQAAYFCEALLGIGAKGTVTQPYARPEPTRPSELTPVSEKWERGICGLRRGDGERELAAFLGPPHYRSELANGGLLLQWEEGSAGVSADFDEEGLEKVTALQENKIPRPDDRIKPRPDWKPNKTTLIEMESVLGKGSVVAVEWERGMSIPLDRAKKLGLDLHSVTPGCSQRVLWPKLDTGIGAGLRFREGVLKGVL